MDKKLFDKFHLVKNLPKSIIKEIDNCEYDIPESLFDKIFESEELKIFINSPVLPKIEEITKKSLLAAELKKKLEFLGNKKQSKTKTNE